MNNKFLSIIFLSIFCINALNAQKKNTPSFKEKTFDLAYAKYKNALKILDYNTAINATHEILAVVPEKINFKDSLLALYYTSNKPTNSVLLAKEMVKEGNTNPTTYEILATTYQKAGMLKESLEYYEKIQAINKDLFYEYQIATIQFNLGRLQECATSLNSIINNPEAKNATIKMDYEKETSQNVPFSAAAFNVFGVLSQQLKEEEQAKKYFENALKIFPEFILSKNNLEILNK